MQEHLARWVSVIGHPFLLMPLLTGIIAFHLLPPREAVVVELVALTVVIIPAGVLTLYKVRRGSWSDLDVSRHHERRQFYSILLPLLALIVLISLYATVPIAIPLGATAIMTLVAAAYLLNSRIKVSLHTGFSVFVAIALMLIMPLAGVAALALASLVAWSRIVLRRHTIAEVLVGALLGSIIGGCFVAIIHNFNL